MAGLVLALAVTGRDILDLVLEAVVRWAIVFVFSQLGSRRDKGCWSDAKDTSVDADGDEGEHGEQDNL
jgi:hypothetical protein